MSGFYGRASVALALVALGTLAGPSAYRVFSERHARGNGSIEKCAGDYIWERLERGGTGWRELGECVGFEEAVDTSRAR
jgi:hypothetical protein